VSSYSAGWSEPNPLGNTPAALLGLSNVASNDSVYYRLDGLYPITAPFAGGGQDIDNVNNVNAAGTVNAAAVVTTGNATVGGSANVTGSVTAGVAVAAPLASASNVAVSNAILSPGTLQVQNSAGTAPAPISTGNETVTGNATISGTLQLGNVAAAGTACSGTAIAGDSDGSGTYLSCQFGQWLPIGGHLLAQATYTIANGTVVPAPACAAGSLPAIIVAAQNFGVDTTATVNFGHAIGTGPWTTQILDGAGAAVPGGQGQATTYCDF
jgi:hypothetical protein